MKTKGEYFSEFCDSTSCHGVSQLANDRYNKALRVAMVVVLTTSLSVVAVNVVVAIANYFRYPHYQSVTKTFTSNKPFPSVSVCNVVPVTPEILFAKASEAFSCGTFTNTLPHKKYDAYPLFFENVEGIGAYTWKVDDIIINCEYGGKPCNKSKITGFLNPYYGRCFTIDMGDDSAKSAGGDNGLSLILFAYSPILTVEEQINFPYGYAGMTELNSHGLQLMVHNPRHFVNPYENSLKIAPGFSTSIFVYPVKTKRLSAPFESNCTNQVAIEFYRYSKATCLRFCEQSYVVDKCHCKDSDLPLQQHPQVPFCGNTTAIDDCTFVKLANQVDCMFNAKKDFYEKNHVHCDCQEACAEFNYKLSQSALYWPNNYMPAAFYRKYVQNNTASSAYKELSKHSMEYILKNKLINTNFAQVTVSFNTDETEVITEHAYYVDGLWSLLSEIGGYLGFWCGISIMTLTDAFFFVIKIIIEKRKANKPTNIVIRN